MEDYFENNNYFYYMAERKRIYLCLAHMSDEGLEQKAIMVHG
jgi:hypothetical protein